jgi:hypothetical protein
MLPMPTSDMSMGMASYGKAFMTLSERKLPWSHMHISTLLDREGDVASGGHCRHTLESAALLVTEKVSATQSVHAEELSAE